MFSPGRLLTLRVAMAIVCAWLHACCNNAAESSGEPDASAEDAPTDRTVFEPGPPRIPAKGAGFTCEVKKLLTTKCQSCHSDPPQGGALVALMDVKHMLAWSKTDPTKTVAEVSLARMQDLQAPMPPTTFHDPATADEIQAFEAWLQANLIGFCQGAVPPNATCTTCHGEAGRTGAAGTDPQLAVAPPRGTNGEKVPTQAAVGAHQAHLTHTDLVASPIQCADCHALPTSMAHSNGLIDMAWGPLAKAGGANPDFNGTTCTNVYCHGAFAGGQTGFAPAWTGGPMDCGSCHGAPPATPPHANRAAECSMCHGAGYSQNAKTVKKTTHINGVVDVNYASATCESCHGDIARVGIAGADTQVKAAPPNGTKGDTPATTRAVGAHQAHVNQATWSSKPLSCAECHVVPTSTAHSNGAVDMAFGALAKTGGAAPAWNGTTCANTYCHGAFFGGISSQPTWASPGGVACGTSCHALPPATPAHTNPATECSNCHGPGYSQTTKTVNKATHINGVLDTSSTGQTCSTCHGDNARVAIAGADPGVKFAPPVGTRGETATSARAVGAHQAHVNKGTFSTPVACNECHLVPISVAHSNAKVDIQWGARAKAGNVTPVWNGTTCTASYCHGNFPGGNTGAAPNWTTTGTLACNACHSLPPSTPAHSNPGLACSTCHGPGYSSTQQTVNKTLHVNGVVDVDSSSMSCTSCHGDTARVALAGADPALKSSPPVGTKAETATSTRAVGMHQGHVNTGTFARPTACAECHIVPITNGHSNSKVDIAFGALAKAGGANPTWNGTTCTGSYCHGNYPGGNTSAAPSWTSGTVNCTSCHGNPPATPPHANTALACSLCHGPSYGATAVNKTTHMDGIVNVDSTALTCTSCHGDSGRAGIAGSDPKQVSAPPVGVRGETATNTRAVGTHQAHLNKSNFAAAPTQCNACHAVPSSNLHSDGVKQVTFGALAKTGGVTPTFNGTGCAGTYCHGNFPGGATTAVPSWTGGTMTCTSCHGNPPNSGDHGDHRREACGDCHGAGYTTSALNKPLHLNGVNDVSGPKITSYNRSTKSCSSTCHGTEKW